jgi:hypothetical protein
MIAALVLAAPSFAEEPEPSGTVDIEEFSIAYLGQATLGHGSLEFGGETYRFKVGGLGAGGAGISTVSAKGHVYNLESLDQFPGNYVEGRSGIVVGDASTGELWLTNTAGVVLRLKAKREGMMLALGADAIVITMEE